MMRKRTSGGRSINFMLTAAFMSCMGLLLVFVASSLIPRLSSMLEKSAIERTKETVMQSVNTVDIYIENLLSTLYFTTTALPDDPETQAAEWGSQMELIRKSNDSITSIALFNEGGRLLASAGGQTQHISPEEVAHAEWFAKALAWGGTATYFSPPHVQHLFAGQYAYVLSMARAVFYQKDGQLMRGVVLMDIDYNHLAALTQAVTLGESGYIYVLDRQGELIAHPRLQLIYSGMAHEELAEVQRLLVGQGSDKVDGRDRVLISATLDQTRWRMVGVAYLDELLAMQRAFLQTMTIVIICAALLSFAVATVMAYWVTRPIRKLEASLRRVEGGDLNVTLSENGFREMRAVSSAFNMMLKRVRELMQQIVHEQEKKRLYELNALQAQINPHFLYNTLDSIIWMEERGRGKEAITMVSALAKLFRISISKGRSIITVREELEHVRNYLIIQKMRFKDKFTYEITSQEEALGERTVKLIVQPLVENAINHAIDETSTEALNIRIDARVTENDLIFTVTDDGIGMPPEVVETLLTAPAGKSGIGVKNVHERIQLTYGDRYGLTVHSEEDFGTEVSIRLPRNWEGEQK